MHLTRQSDYGVRAVLHLAGRAYGDVVQTREIAAREDIPAKYLPSIIRTLARAGIIRTMRGNQGGVTLAKPPEEINLREVIEAIEGPIALVQCMKEPGQCARQDDCAFMPVCEDIQGVMMRQLEGTTFADMAAGVSVKIEKGGAKSSPGSRSPRKAARPRGGGLDQAPGAGR